MTGEAAYRAWVATLPPDEYEVAERVYSMDGGSHATAYLAVLVYRLEKRALWKDMAKALGAIGAFVAAAVAGWKGAQ